MKVITTSLNQDYCAMQRKHPDILWFGDESRREITLTFDDGPHPKDTPQVLEKLAKHNIQATFFLVGRYVEQHPNLVKQIHQSGHQLGIHGFRHRPFPLEKPSTLQIQLDRTRNTIANVCGISPEAIKDLRPPYGTFTVKTVSMLARWGYRLVLWNKIPPHWMQPLSWTIEQVLDQIHPGWIIVLHDKRDLPKSFSEHFRQTLPKLQSLLLKDSENISNNIYPVEVLLPESPVAHVLRLPVIIVDAFAAAKRREKKETKEFQERLMDLVEETPEYYKRNFHFQTNGYFGEDSAKIYDHQVEVLFSGTADAMRRLIIPRLKRHFNNDDGLGKHFLEIGCGTGSLTRFIALAFPKAKITCVDLSSSYLKVASQRLKKLDRINYLQGAAESLSLKSETFDAVFSCFLFHELPKAVRLHYSRRQKAT